MIAAMIPTQRADSVVSSCTLNTVASLAIQLAYERQHEQGVCHANPGSGWAGPLRAGAAGWRPCGWTGRRSRRSDGTPRLGVIEERPALLESSRAAAPGRS